MQHKDYSTVVTLFVARCMALKQARLSPLVVFDSIGCVSAEKAPEPVSGLPVELPSASLYLFHYKKKHAIFLDNHSARG